MSDLPPHTYREPDTNGLGIAGFVVSLVGLLGGCVGTIVLSPVGLILSAVAMRRPPRGFAIAGLVLGIIGSAWLLIGALVVGTIGIGTFALVREFGTANEVERSVIFFHRDNGRLPADLGELAIRYPGTPITDRRGNPLGYQVNSPSSYTITMPGPDGVIGTADDRKFHNILSTGTTSTPTTRGRSSPVGPPP